MKPKRGFLTFAKNALLVMAGMALFLALVAYSEGAVMVYVHQKPHGARIFVPVPALLVTQGLRFVPQRDLDAACRDLHQWLPAIKAASHELRREPDGVLVEVRDRAEHVLISKRGDDLVIDVDDPDETVHLSLPLEAFSSLAERLTDDESPI
jgi:hypothetical protein